MATSFKTHLEVEASEDEVFDYFTKPELLVRWMGDHARLEAVEGGVFAVDINGVIIRGTFLRLERPRLIEVGWGEAGNPAMPPGSTRLVIRLSPGGAGTGTRIDLEHSGLSDGEAQKHALGWPHFLGRLKVLGDRGDPGPNPWGVAPPQ